jgi:hypothetical protein
MGRLRELFKRRRREERDAFPPTREGKHLQITWDSFTERADLARFEADHLWKIYRMRRRLVAQLRRQQARRATRGIGSTEPIDEPIRLTEEVSLVLRLGDRDPDGRRAAAQVLHGRTLHDPEAALMLVWQLRDRNAEKRRTAVELLQGTTLTHESAAILLVDLLRDRNAEYRKAAGQALQGTTIGSSEAAEYLSMIRGDQGQPSGSEEH